MLDLNRLERISLSPNPVGQKVVGTFLLMPTYDLPPRVQIDIEGFENVPDEPVIYAMNHTDRYNYWPFQYKLWRSFDRFTSTWVKGKYYENEWVGKFMELTNNIPTVSRGYIIARDFKAVCDRSPTGEEYRALRTAVDLAAGAEQAPEDMVDLAVVVPHAVLDRPRNVLGRRFSPGRETYTTYINDLFGQMMGVFNHLNREAFEKGLDLLVFPQGTRSIRLSRGRIGLSQTALHLKRTVVPVGCNGSDKVYTGNLPIGSGGHITYRLGEPIRYEEMSEFHIDEPFEPFTAEAENNHRDKFQGYVDVVMERINGLVEPQYQFAQDLSSDGVAGSRRFL
jgi:1-acyl-sn-glycerol-3-phosphate acyltransferase